MINNNRQQNGRRRGRGGQRQGGGNQGNGSRIDNRARGNAVQLLEKYKSLAADAQRQGDRVNTEYYLQFADHYFRVVSEQRGRFEEQDRQRQQGQGGYDSNFDGSFGDGDDFDGDEQDARETQAPRETGREQGQRDGNRDGREQGREQPREQGREQSREPRRADGNRDGARDNARDGGREPGREPRRERFQREPDAPSEGVAALEGEPVTADEQPQPKPRRGRPPRREEAEPANTLDAAVLPPSFAPANDGGDGDAAEAKPRRRRLRPAGEASAG